jgi:hypothetical protein
MATYATQTDFEDYSDGWVTTDPAGLEKVLQAAERDIGRVLGYQGLLADDQVLKLVPAELTARQRDALARATCAQAEYRIEKGPAFFRQAQYASVSGPQFSTQGRLPRIGPKVPEELAGSGLTTGGWALITR